MDDGSDFIDPGQYLSATMEIDSATSDDEDEFFALHESTEQKEKLQALSLALLQVAQSIEFKYLKPPFGLNRSASQKAIRKVNKLFARWEISLMHCTSFAQIFVHFHALDDSIIWTQSAANAHCRICRRQSEPNKMLLCDNCNKGVHMFCLKPKLEEVPEGDWFCDSCKPAEEFKTTVKRRRINYNEDTIVEEEEDDDKEEQSEEENEEEDEVDEVEEDEDDEEAENNDEVESQSETEEELPIFKIKSKPPPSKGKASAKSRTTSSRSKQSSKRSSPEILVVCHICRSGGEMVDCEKCLNSYHIECMDPPLKKAPRGKWTCGKCARRSNGARKFNAGLATVLHHQPRRCAVASRTRILGFTRSLRRSSIDDETDSPSEEPVSSRRSRRALDNEANGLLLHNVELQNLLTDITKHKDSWPFMRPVSKSEVPDYFDIVKHPMDFSKIKSKLNLGEYKLDQEVLGDIKLVFENCDAYNNNGSTVFKAGMRLEKYVQQRCQELSLHIPDEPETKRKRRMF